MGGGEVQGSSTAHYAASRLSSFWMAFDHVGRSQRVTELKRMLTALIQKLNADR
jgi:hypothetical protein